MVFILNETVFSSLNTKQTFPQQDKQTRGGIKKRERERRNTNSRYKLQIFENAFSPKTLDWEYLKQIQLIIKNIQCHGQRSLEVYSP